MTTAAAIPNPSTLASTKYELVIETDAGKYLCWYTARRSRSAILSWIDDCPQSQRETLVREFGDCHIKYAGKGADGISIIRNGQQVARVYFSGRTERDVRNEQKPLPRF